MSEIKISNRVRNEFIIRDERRFLKWWQPIQLLKCIVCGKIPTKENKNFSYFGSIVCREHYSEQHGDPYLNFIEFDIEQGGRDG